MIAVLPFNFLVSNNIFVMSKSIHEAQVLSGLIWKVEKKNSNQSGWLKILGTAVILNELY